MIKKIAFAPLLMSISLLQAMDPGATARKVTATTKSRGAKPERNGAEEKVRECINLMHDYVRNGGRKSELKNQVERAWQAVADRKLEVRMVNPFGVGKKEELLSIHSALTLTYFRVQTIKLAILGKDKKDQQAAIKASGVAKNVAKELGISQKQAIKQLQADWNDGVFDRVYEMCDLCLEGLGGLSFPDDDEHEVRTVAPVQPATPVVHEVTASLAENVNQFLRNADAACKDAITDALANGADREVVVQALVAQEAKLKSLTRSWDEYQHAEGPRLDVRVQNKVLQEGITAEQALALLKDEHEKAQKRIQDVVGGRINQLRDLLADGNEDGGDTSVGGASDTISSESASTPRSENEDQDVSLNGGNKNVASPTKPDEGDARYGTHLPPNNGSWSGWFSYKKAAALVGVVIVATIAGKKYYDTKDKKSTRVV